MKLIIHFLTIFIGIVFFYFICISSIHSLYFGVEPYDEAFYIATSYYLTLGAHSFIDLFYLPLPNSFLYPFITFFYKLTGSTEGIILFSRYLYFIVSLLLAGLITTLLKKNFTFTVALVIASICIIFVPFNIHALSYNTLGMIFLTIALFLNYYAFTNKKEFFLFFSGIFLFSATIVYPTFAILIPLIETIFWLQLDGKINYKIRILMIFNLGLFIGGIWFLWLLVHAGFHQIMKDLSESLSSGAQRGSLSKIINIINLVKLEIPHPNLIAFIFSLYIGINYFFWEIRLTWIINLLIIIALLKIIRTDTTSIYIRHLALLSPFLYLAIKKNFTKKKLLILVVLPSLSAGIISSWTSSNGVYNAMIGLFPAAIVTLCYLAMFISENVDHFIKTQHYSDLLVISILIFTLYPLKIGNSSYNYGDLPNTQLTAKMTYGIYKGIYTTPEKKSYYEQIEKDIRNLGRNHKNILFLDDFPAGYLMSNMIPMTNNLWLISPLVYPKMNHKIILEYYQSKKMLPDIIVQIIHVAQNPNPKVYKYQYLSNDPLIQLLDMYHIGLKRPNYKIYLLNNNAIHLFFIKKL